MAIHHIMRFPLYQRPNSLVFLDDDSSYLEMIAMVMPREWGVRLFTHVDDCLDYFKTEHELWETDVWLHQQLADSARNSTSLIPNVLEYWKSNKNRYNLTQTCVVDFSMPAMTGLEFLRKLQQFPPNRVLLTGKADELIAVGAFNDGLIDRFIPKQHHDIGKYLSGVLTEQHAKPMEFHEGIWRNALSKAQYAVLQESTVQLDLHKLVRERQWIEYIVLPAPFGILALDRYAQAHWLQLELRSDLDSAADLAQSTGQTSAVVAQVRSGTHLVNTELLLSLNQSQEASALPAFDLGISNGLVGAFFPVPGRSSCGIGYEEFLAHAPPRSLSGDSQS